MPEKNMQSAIIESGRAAFALSEVKRVIGADSVSLKELLAQNETKKVKEFKEYKSYSKKFPSMVLANGLAASLAFLKDKGGTYNHLFEHIDKWLKQCGLISKDTMLMEYICGLETPQYRVVTKEVLALFNWLRRFASGMIEGE